MPQAGRTPHGYREGGLVLYWGALGGAKLKAVTILCSQELVPARELFQLRAHVLHFEYRYGPYDVGPTVPENANCG